MYYCKYLIFITLVALSMAKCPYTPHDVKSCIATSLPNFGLGPPANASSPVALREGMSMARDSCRSDALMEAASCIQMILDACKGMSEVEQQLQRLFSKDKIIQTVRYFCNNLDVYDKYTKCITEQHPQAVNCAMGERENIIKLKTAGATIDVLILATCKYQDTAMTCLGEKINDNCGNEAAVFFETIALGTRPPDCVEVKPKYKAVTTESKDSPNSVTSTVVLSWTLFVCCLFSYLL